MPIVPTAVPFEHALRIVLDAAASVRQAADPAAPAKAQSVPLLESLGRVLALPLLADRDQPPFARSTRDGFAVQAAALSANALTIIGQLRAGQLWQGSDVTSTTAIEIMTGAPLPPGADSVLMVEHASRAGDTLRLNPGRTLAAGDNVVPRAAEAARGQQIVPAGTRIGPAEIALAASCGATHLDVFPQSRVAIVATGDELVDLTETPAPQQIRNSNTYALAAMVASAGGHPGRLPIARDTRENIRERVLQGRMWDLLILSGGVSMGAYDLVEEVLEEFQAEFLFTAVAMQPGKPVVFGRLPARQHHPDATPEPGCYFFGLPGNPISTQVTFHALVEPFLRALSGEPYPTPRWAQATLADAVKAGPNVTRLLPARLAGTNVTITPWHGSGDLAANARANCYAELLPGTAYAAGHVIRILLR